ncbi:hypothetical protein LZ30DRAFT_704361 [Colletotrichum cereale]|nr:hypothetical protein LZ30DRAFT_704361 [Colletotrichum cereale]
MKRKRRRGVCVRVCVCCVCVFAAQSERHGREKGIENRVLLLLLLMLRGYGVEGRSASWTRDWIGFKGLGSGQYVYP